MTSIKKTAAALAIGAAAVAAWAQSPGFHFFGVYSRFVTPSGAGNGHPAVFCFDNPAYSGVTVDIFNLVGRQVATLPAPQQVPLPTPNPNHACSQTSAIPSIPVQYAIWDGTSNGSFVHSGIYIYRVKAEGGTYTGSIVVVK
jgi:hypothetical protein